MRQLRVASLFSGCGGTDLGFQGGFTYLSKKHSKNPVKIVYANEIEPKFCALYNENFSHTAHQDDIRQVDAKDIPDHDILTAGFPCQSFSIVAQNPIRLGVKDENNGSLFFEICRVLKEKQPSCFVAENVKGLISANKGLAFPLILQEFRNCGYHVMHMLLHANHYGVPQRRQRVFIVGFKDPTHLGLFCPPIPSEEQAVLGSVLFPEEEIEDKYYFSKRAVEGLKKSNKAMNKGRAQDPNQPCNTVGAHLAKVSLNSTDPVLCINNRYRRFTPREVARIQSFPDNFKLTGSETYQYKSIGNAIPPVLAWYVAQSVTKALNHKHAKIIQASEVKESVCIDNQYQINTNQTFDPSRIVALASG